ncbi:MAG TPA: IS21-like element helper ATPase IstB [Gemmataceae bacterium]|nr:IS21-like element helper ATPase IstB [Gemmataceae bacterium]
MSQDVTAALTRCLQELRLAAVRSQYEAVARQATAESWGYAAFLLEVMQRECQQRQHHRIERLLKASKLSLEKSWSALDLKRLPTKAGQQLRSLLSGDFLDRRENVLVFGPPGSGKTHALNGLSLELVRTGRRVLFTKCSLLVQELLKAKRDLDLKGILRELSRWEGLVIDDLGYVQQSREEMEVLFTLLAERYERGSVLVTSNLAFSQWEQIFKDPMTTAAAIDRLVHHSVIVELNVPSYRAEAAKRTRSGPPPKEG